MRALEFRNFGPPNVITIVDKKNPTPDPQQVLVEVAYAGLNPVDSKRRRGFVEGVPLPSGVGREFSGVVKEIGIDVRGFQPGDLVLGSGEGIIGEFLAVDDSLLAPVPSGVGMQQAACLPVAPQTAWFAFNSQNVNDESTVFVSGASGGVGSIVAQLAIARGATVIGSARTSNHDTLRSWGVTPLNYAENLVEGLKRLAPEGIDIVFDHTGEDTILAALALGVPASRINSTSGAGLLHNTPTVGRKGINREVIAELGQLLSTGTIQLSIDRVFDWVKAIDAYTYLDSGTAAGKIVLQFPIARE